jgi:hypothetical protein
MALDDMGPFVLEHRRELIGLELCTQALRQHHSPVPTGQGEREQMLAGHGLDCSFSRLRVIGVFLIIMARKQARRSLRLVGQRELRTIEATVSVPSGPVRESNRTLRHMVHEDQTSASRPTHQTRDPFQV